jgi:predicted GIY-YIG superfamily endonuclease
VHGLSGMAPKHFVYVLQSLLEPDRHYTGLTDDVNRRLRWHNSAASGVTVRHRPSF